MQLIILRTIEYNPAISGAQLARDCFVTPQAMAANIAKLEAAGLIARSKGEGRALETHLTDKGRAIFDRAGSRVAIRRALHRRGYRRRDGGQLDTYPTRSHRLHAKERRRHDVADLGY